MKDKIIHQSLFYNNYFYRYYFPLYLHRYEKKKHIKFTHKSEKKINKISRSINDIDSDFFKIIKKKSKIENINWGQITESVFVYQCIKKKLWVQRPDDLSCVTWASFNQLYNFIRAFHTYTRTDKKKKSFFLKKTKNDLWLHE